MTKFKGIHRNYYCKTHSGATQPVKRGLNYEGRPKTYKKKVRL